MRHAGLFGFLVVWYCVLFAIGMASAEDWTAYRHDSARSGVTTEKLTTPLSLRWTFRPAHAPEPAWMKPAEELQRMHFDSAHHVTVADGTVYFGSSVDNKVYAVDAETGQMRWTFFTEGPVRFAPAIWKDRIYLGSDDGYVYCLRARNGKPVWKYRAGPTDEKVIGNGRMISLWPVRTSVLVDNGVLYFGAGVFPYEGIYICALKADDGTIIWKNDTIGDHTHELAYGGISPQSYLVASENILYVPSGRAMPAAFDRESGRFLYYCSPPGKVGGTWALVEGGELIAGVDRSGTPAKVVYDQETGRGKGDAYAWFPGLDMVVTPGVAYTLSNEGIHAIDRTAYPDASKKLSSLREERQKLGALLTDLRGKLAEKTEKAQKVGEGETPAEPTLDSQVDKITERIDYLAAEEEKLLKALACKWQYLRKDLYSLILAGDTVFAGGEGIVIAVDAGTGKEIWSSQVDGISLGLAASSGSLFVSTDKGPVYCFGKTVAQASLPVIQEAKEINPSPYSEDNPRVRGGYESAAEAILQETGIKKGYCLVLDAGTGRLAFELARRSELKIIGIEDDPKKVEEAKKNLDAAGLYGSRVVVESWDLSSLPDYFANLIVPDSAVAPGKASGWSKEMFRVWRPYGGVAYIPNISSWIPEDPECRSQESNIKSLIMYTRGKLEGAGSWTQLYANPQNTACSDDQLVKVPLGVLWFGEPGPEKMVERHGRASSPVAINGRLFVQGGEIVMAYDAYNGTLLWEREIPGAVRVRVDVDGGNLVATEDGLYVAAYDKCYRLDPATGETVRIYEMPASPAGSPRRWGYISCVDGILFGSTVIPLKSEYAYLWKEFVNDDGTWKGADKIPAEYRITYERYTASYPVPDENALADLHRSADLWASMANFPSWGSQRDPKGSLTERMMAGDTIFAMDTETGKLLWMHQGSRIANIAVTIGDGTIFLADASVTEEQREEALKEKQKLVKSGIYEESDAANLESKEMDVRLVVALDAATGKKLWEKPLDLTGCGGDKMGAVYHDGLLLFYGHFSNHDEGYFVGGSLKWRRITTLQGKTGDMVWSRPLNYLRRPLVVGDTIVIEPRACDLRTGEIKMRSHPITGQQVPWQFLRPGHSCGITSASPNAIFYRSYCTAIYDMVEDRGLTLFGGIRPGCWINLISANGLLLFPEASSGCTCSFPLRTTVVMKHRGQDMRQETQNRDTLKSLNVERGTTSTISGLKSKEWTVFITDGAMTPAKHFAINLGAPGDMRDDEGTLWLGYPRLATQSKYGSYGYGVKFDLHEKVLQGMGYFCQDFRGANVEGSDRPWLFTSGCLGLLQCEVPLIDDTWGEEPGVYTVRLGFMAPSGDRKGKRVFDVKLQDEVVLEDFDILKAAGAPDKAVIKEFNGIKVENNLTVELAPKTSDPTIAQAPMISFIEAVREDVKVSEVPETVKSMKAEEAEDLLKGAKAELDKKNQDKALGMYHTVFDAAPSLITQIRALEGMAVIGSPKSLSRIARYCKDVSPILWDYKEPKPELRDGAVKAYIAVANNIAEVDKQKAIKMLSRAFAITSDLDIRQQVAISLENLGVGIDVEAAKAGFIARWHLVGPFPWDASKNTLDKVFIDEPSVDTGRSYQIGDRILKWSRYISDQGMIDLEKLFDPHENVSAYAYAEVLLPEDQDLLLKIGSDDGFKCWFNGKLVGRFDSDRAWILDEDVLKVKAKKDTNTILLKISQGGGGWAFSAKLTDMDGNPIRCQVK